MPVPNFPTRTELTNLISANLAGSPNTISAASHRDVENAIVNAIYGGQIGDIKEIACDSAYISTHFDLVTGKGKQTGDRYGWAICDGRNNTVDKRGKVAIGYDPLNYNVMYLDNPNIGATGGEKTHTLDITEMPPHSHLMKQGNVQGNQYGIYSYTSGDDATGGVINNATTTPGINTIPPTMITGGAGSTSTINTTGGLTVPHNNMQPYVVTLFIQRIPTV